MADSKISALPDGGDLAAGDYLPIDRGGSNYKAKARSGLQLLYDYTVTGADKASIDTAVDGAMAGLFATTYRVLEIWLVSRTDEAVLESQIDLTLNNDTAANYWRGYVATSSTGTTPVGSQSTAAEAAIFAITAGASMDANIPGITRMSIPFYADTTFFKVAEWISSVVNDVSGAADRQVTFEQTLYKSTSAITRIKVAPHTAGKNLKVGTRLAVFAR